MKRRGFLGFMGGAVAAGPGMAKQAMVQIGDLSIPMSGGIARGFNTDPNEAPTYSGGDDGWQMERWSTFQKFLLSPEKLWKRRLDTHVNFLDPDIAQMRSISMVSKIRMQRDRNFSQWLRSEANWLQRAMSDENGSDDY
jgi:hypothetical protein